MRIVIALVIGLLAGALGGIRAYQSLSAGNEIPHAVMWMMRYHLTAIGKAVKSGDCGPEAVTGHLAGMASAARNIEPIFLPIDDELQGIFVDHADKLREGIAAMQGSVGTGCKALGEARSQTSDACQACHRDFKQ